jgi:hypothetical protein
VTTSKFYATGTVVLWALIGLFGGLAIGMGIAPAFGFPQMEGSSAIFGVLIGAPLGAIAGILLGLTVARSAGEDERKQKIVAGSTVAVGIVFLLSNSMFSSGENRPINPGGSSPSMFFEIRLPAGAPPPARNDVRAEMQVAGSPRAADASYSLKLESDGDRAVIRGNVEMYARSPKRTLALHVAGKPTHLFSLKLAEKPTYSDVLGAWQATDQLEESGAKRAPAPGEAYEIRYRVHGY